jgi:hypothetical protein
MRCAPCQPEYFFRVYFCVRVVLQPFSFFSADFVNGAAVWAGDKITFPESKHGNKKENKPLTCTSDNRHGIFDSTAGEISALPRAQISGVARYRKEEEHEITSRI